jgi:L-ascorbate metabolism protein UlaG (beta-lactamase superfamily)
VDADTYHRYYQLQRANAERPVPRYRSLVWHWMRRLLRAPRRAKVAPLPSVSPGQVSVSFAGHASLLIRYHQLAIACDPMLGSFCHGVRREVEPGLSPAEFGDIELVLISHPHADHLHRETLARLPRSATVVVPPRTAREVSGLGFARVLELAAGQSVEHRGVAIYSQAVRHECNPPALSYVIHGNGPSVYFCGDSGYFSGFAEIGRRFRPDIALLPIGGYHPAPFRERHMSPLDALYAFEDLCARVMIPHHYGAFPFSYERIEDPAQWLAELVAERSLDGYVVALAPGESRVFARPEADALGRSRGRGVRAEEASLVVAPRRPQPGSRAAV